MYLALERQGKRTTGPLVIPSATILLFTPHSIRALLPLFVLATRHPSVVAIGT